MKLSEKEFKEWQMARWKKSLDNDVVALRESVGSRVAPRLWQGGKPHNIEIKRGRRDLSADHRLDLPLAHAVDSSIRYQCAGFHLIILAASELQPLKSSRVELSGEQTQGSFPGVTVFQTPLDDRPLDLRWRLDLADVLSGRHPQQRLLAANSTDALHSISLIEEAANLVANCLSIGGRVLVTCHMGLNRSGVISARALQKLGVETERAIGLVKSARPGALFNKSFVAYLRGR